MRSLGFLPLWFVLPMTVGLVMLVYLVVREIDPWLAAYVVRAGDACRSCSCLAHRTHQPASVTLRA